jgi:hypothetical protein
MTLGPTTPRFKTLGFVQRPGHIDETIKAIGAISTIELNNRFCQHDKVGIVHSLFSLSAATFTIDRLDQLARARKRSVRS